MKINQINPSTESGNQPYQQNRIYDCDGEVPALCSGKSDLLIAPPKDRGITRPGGVCDTKQQLEMRDDENTNTITGVQKDNLVVTERIAGWHENENVIAAHMGDEKRSTAQEHVYHKETGQLTAMGTAHVPNVILTEPYIKNVPHGFNNGIEKKYPNLRGNSSSEHNEILIQGANIRRLTEIECERLQGFEDNWTEFGNYDGVIKKIPKTQRYKLMGNAVTVGIVALVASRININTEAPNR